VCGFLEPRWDILLLFEYLLSPGVRDLPGSIGPAPSPGEGRGEGPDDRCCSPDEFANEIVRYEVGKVGMPHSVKGQRRLKADPCILLLRTLYSIPLSAMNNGYLSLAVVPVFSSLSEGSED